MIRPILRTHPRRSLYLHGKTRAAHLRLVRMYPQRGKNPRRCADALLSSSNGDFVGYMRLNELAGDVLKMTADDCYVIELSRGSTTFSDGFLDRFTEYMYPEILIAKDATYEFVNIMWIVMVDGVAYRKAVGRVLKAAWQRIPTREVRVTIG